MYIHGCSQPGVVHLNSRDAVLHNNSAPLPVNRIVVRQESHAYLYRSHHEVGVADRQTQAIANDWPGHRVPQFGDILMRIEESRALSRKLGKGGVNELVLGIGSP